MKVGFICEGKTEKKIVESDNFQQFLKSVDITCVPDIIDVEGYCNLSAEKLLPFTQILIDKGAQKIIILTDLDADACITITKERINAPDDHLVIVSVKQIEAWFLADDACMSAVFKTNMHFDFPEHEANPFELIKQELIRLTGRGVMDKVFLVRKMLRNNFSVINAAAHPNCSSAKYFVDKLKALALTT